MVATEIRIGNWVECQSTASESIYHKVTGITEENIFLDAITFDYLTLEDIEPIHLTEEILLKCGAVKAIDEWFVNDKCFQFFDNGFCYSAGLGYQLSLPIKFLHQLQNLYFALTGTELNVSL